MSKSLLGWPIAGAMLLLAAFSAAAQPAPSSVVADASLRSTPDTVIWGYFAADAPLLEVRHGLLARIELRDQPQHALPAGPTPLRSACALSTVTVAASTGASQINPIRRTQTPPSLHQADMKLRLTRRQ